MNLEHPVATFLEGPIPKNSYHNTLAFRMSMVLNREPNNSNEHKEWKAQQEEKKRIEKEKLYNKLNEE